MARRSMPATWMCLMLRARVYIDTSTRRVSFCPNEQSNVLGASSIISWDTENYTAATTTRSIKENPSAAPHHRQVVQVRIFDECFSNEPIHIQHKKFMLCTDVQQYICSPHGYAKQRGVRFVRHASSRNRSYTQIAIPMRKH